MTPAMIASRVALSRQAAATTGTPLLPRDPDPLVLDPSAIFSDGLLR